MRKLFSSIVSVVTLATGCSDVSHPILPTAPSQVPAAAPAPAFGFSEPYTPISVGDVITRRAGTGDSECVDLPGWYCHYFRLTAPSDGRIDILLKWVLETQPTQPLDLSLTSSSGGTFWSEYGPGPQDRLRVSVTAGSIHQITVWYTFPGVEFELRSSLELN
jgi:hypothetical protein